MANTSQNGDQALPHTETPRLKLHAILKKQQEAQSVGSNQYQPALRPPREEYE